MKTLNSKIIKALNTARVELADIRNMKLDNIAIVKGIGPKYLKEIEEYIGSLEPEVRVPVYTSKSIELIREHILSNKACQEVFNSTKADKDVKYVTSMFLNREVDYRGLAHAVDSLYAKEDQIAIAIGKLSHKVKFSIGKEWSNFHFEKMKVIMASLLIHGLVDTEQVLTMKKDVKEIVDGKTTFKRKVTFVTMGTKREDNPLKGIHIEPGVVIQKHVKIKTGGKPFKINSAQKNFLSQVSSMPLRLIKTPRKIMEKYLKQTKWYKQAESGATAEHPLKLEDRVQVLLDNIKKAQDIPVIYLSAWLDYRNRMYYDFTLEGINPHGKTFQTSQWELAIPLVIDGEAIHHYYYSAVCIVDGRTSHEVASRRFLAKKAKYLKALRKDTGDMDKDFYNSRLADAIEDYDNGRASSFLLSEDATNGGMQHAGIGFKCEPMMKSSNVGGLKTQQDSHAELQKKLGLSDRQDAKDIHQPLLHGSSIATIAKSMNISDAEAEAMMIKAYGPEVMNIPAIADWGSKIINNFNTSLTWKSIDDFLCQSIAYVESVPLIIYAPSGSNKSGYSTTTVSRDMPIYKNNKGQMVYGKTAKKDSKGMPLKDKEGNIIYDKRFGGDIKIRGLHANTTHSGDGFCLRSAIRFLIKAGAVGLFKHDNFLCHGNFMSTVRVGYKSGLLRSFDFDIYGSMITDVRASFKGSTTDLSLKYGKGTKDMIEKSNYFLSA